MNEEERGGTSSLAILGAFVLGGLIGAGIALLTAPTTGREAREHVGRWARETSDKARQRAGQFARDAGERVKSAVGSAREKLGRTEQAVDDTVENI